jgi:hypothetical protein
LIGKTLLGEFSRTIFASNTLNKSIFEKKFIFLTVDLGQKFPHFPFFLDVDFFAFLAVSTIPRPVHSTGHTLQTPRQGF